MTKLTSARTHAAAHVAAMATLTGNGAADKLVIHAQEAINLQQGMRPRQVGAELRKTAVVVFYREAVARINLHHIKNGLEIPAGAAEFFELIYAPFTVELLAEIIEQHTVVTHDQWRTLVADRPTPGQDIESSQERLSLMIEFAHSDDPNLAALGLYLIIERQYPTEETQVEMD